MRTNRSERESCNKQKGVERQRQKIIISEFILWTRSEMKQFCYDFVRPRDAVSSRWRGLVLHFFHSDNHNDLNYTVICQQKTSSFSPGVTVSDGNVNNACVDLKKTFALK